MRVQRQLPATLETAKAGFFVRLASCFAAGESAAAWRLAAERQRANERVASAVRAAIPAAGLSDAEWGGTLATDGIAAGFVESIAPASVFYVLAGMGIATPMRIRIVAFSSALTAGSVGEGGAIPVTKGTLEPVTIEPRYAGAIVVLSAGGGCDQSHPTLAVNVLASRNRLAARPRRIDNVVRKGVLW